MSNAFLDTAIEYLKGVGPKRADVLKKEVGIFTFKDLITYYPFRYVDRSKFYKIKEINNDLAYVQLKGYFTSVQEIGEKRARRLVATFHDDTAEIELVWFRGLKWLKGKFQLNKEYIVFGKPALFNNRYNIPHPEVEEVSEEKFLPNEYLQPFYSSTERLKAKGLDSKGISKLSRTLIRSIPGSISESLTTEIIQNLKLISREKALTNIHFPSNPTILKQAQARLIFEELFFIQLGLLKQKNLRLHKIEGQRFSKIGNYFNTFYQKNLPFELTDAQKKVIKEIRTDVGSGKQMNRLLQGDVGSGKTLVAMMTMLMAIDNGCQTCIMAPTEILATQHFETFKKMFEGLGLNINLLTGSTKAAARKTIFEDLINGKTHILIGTHALLEETVQFKNLGLVVIDEQHRFGVAQRARLWKKNVFPPHILVMTATPIPRTLAMTLYGDLDFSVIDKMPPGRKPIKTYHFYDSSRLKLFGFMRQQIQQGHQIYIVYPLIQESETLDLKHLMDGYESIIREFPLPKYAISIMHGQMKPADKDYEMQRFLKKETQIMVSTTVIEVGLDVPDATVMVIENAERFGLSQLHQLRGRVGRRADQSYCILMSADKLSYEARKRIETMVRTSDGFEIAEADLKLRGPGDIQGTQQSGVLDLKLANLLRDEKMIKYARALATKILKEDPLLQKEPNRVLADQLKEINKQRVNFGLIS